ncbi:MAG: two-component regulator propeller domain-containing protein, partial [Bacteroidota bacterium]
MILALCALTSACKGREGKSVNHTSVNGKIGFTDSSLQNKLSNDEVENRGFQLPNFENQISEVVRTIYQDSQGNIWFGTQNGVFQYEGDSLRQLDGVQSESGRKVTIKDIAEGKDSSIWLAHTDGISHIRGDAISNYYERDGLISNDVWCMAVDKHDLLWIGTIEGVSTFDGVDFKNFELPEGKLDTTVGVSSTKMVHSIMEDRKGRMWFSTNGGVFIYDGDALTSISEKEGLNTSFVNEV